MLLFIGLKTEAQLGFCRGNSGDPIFIENFGFGQRDSRLPSGSTTYKFTTTNPRDGSYKVSSKTDWFNWVSIKDHTANDINGKSLIVNASTVPGEFFRIPISGLCENTTYEFSSWLIHLMPSNRPKHVINSKIKPINVKFEIWDSTDTIMLKSGNTGNIFSSTIPKWEQYGLVFQTESGQTSVILKMRNNGRGGYGNDLAIDDIMFRTCGDAVIIEDSLKNTRNLSVNENEQPFSTVLTATPDFSVFSTHFYQWQKSKNGTDWVNITGENNSSFSVKNINDITYYRTLIAEDAINLLNSSCNSTSEVYKVNILAPKKPKKQIPVLKKLIKPRKKVTGIKIPSSIGPTKVNTLGIKEIPKLKKQVDIFNLKGLIKTQKQVIIVKDGFEIINDRVWIDGAIGKFVQTGEKIIKQGHANADIVIEEIIYYKAVYGYNSKKRRYRVHVKPHVLW
ncbi:MAG: hypothetical protein ABJK28_16555 [Algibacter sp.]